MKQFSVVKGRVKKRLMVRGLLFASLGGLILLGMGTFAKVELLTFWGIPSFALGIFLVAFGMIPYRKITKLETHPHQILFDREALTFISNKGSNATIPYREITKIRYFEGKMRYGIWLERKNKGPIFLPFFLNDPGLHKIVHPNEPY